jgi:N-acetyl-anhydromuramyl-L-alanine amidase AmpD
VGLMDVPGQVANIGKQLLMTGAYALSVPNLIQMKQKPAAWVFPRNGTAIDEIILHGTESNASQVKSLDYLASKNSDKHSIHYWIGRDVGLLYALVPEDQSTPHAGNPDHKPNVQDHNFRSIGIEMYQWDPDVLRAKKLPVDFTDWQYNTVAQLVYDICRRRKIKRSMVVGHGTVNPVQRADPQGFDWPRFNRLLDQISAKLGDMLGDDFKLN